MYVLRPATAADYDFLYQLHRDTIRPYVEATWGWDEEEQQERWQNHFDPTGRQIIQLLISDTLTDIGTLELSYNPDNWYIDLIEVAPEYQNQGIGTTIITDLIRQAHAADQPLTLSVLKANTPAGRLYERLGFMITAEDPVRFQMICPLPTNS